jgi:hypothetical protein
LTFAYVVTVLTAIGMVVLLVVMLSPSPSRKRLADVSGHPAAPVGADPAVEHLPPTSLAERVAELRHDIERLREEVAAFRAQAA